MPNDIHELYLRGRACFEKGLLEEAERIFAEVLQHHPHYAEVHNKLGLILYQKGALEKAVESFTRALAINPNYTEASLNLAVTYNELGRYDQAAAVVSRAAQIAHPAPHTVDPYILGKLANEHARLGEIYRELRLYPEAIEELHKALRYRPASVDILTKLGIVHRDQGAYDEAVASFTKAKEANPRYIPAWIHLGLTYYMKGLPGLAVQEWKGALQTDPSSEEARRYLRLVKDEPLAR